MSYFLFDVRNSLASFGPALIFRVANIYLAGLLSFAIVGGAVLAIRILP